MKSIVFILLLVLGGALVYSFTTHLTPQAEVAQMEHDEKVLLKYLEKTSEALKKIRSSEGEFPETLEHAQLPVLRLYPIKMEYSSSGQSFQFKVILNGFVYTMNEQRGSIQREKHSH